MDGLQPPVTHRTAKCFDWKPLVLRLSHSVALMNELSNGDDGIKHMYVKGETSPVAITENIERSSIF